MVPCISEAGCECIVDTEGIEKSEACGIDIRISFTRMDECNVIGSVGHWKAMQCSVNQSSHKVRPNVDSDVHDVHDNKLTVLRKTCTSLKVRRFTWEIWQGTGSMNSVSIFLFYLLIILNIFIGVDEAWENLCSLFGCFHLVYKDNVHRWSFFLVQIGFWN